MLLDPTLYRDLYKTYPKVYSPPSNTSTPRTLFRHEAGEPFVAYRDAEEVLIFTDGACTNNGQEGARGGCAIVSHCTDNIPRPWGPPPGAFSMNGGFWFRLEDVGPTGKHEMQTSNRAELRAVLVALSRNPYGPLSSLSATGQKYTKLVIATDSTYVVDGATNWVKAWESNGWTKSNGEPVKNSDLWQQMLERFRLLQSRFEQISFWHIPRELNEEADRLAKYATTLPRRPQFGIPHRTIPILVDPNYS